MVRVGVRVSISVRIRVRYRLLINHKSDFFRRTKTKNLLKWRYLQPQQNRACVQHTNCVAPKFSSHGKGATSLSLSLSLSLSEHLSETLLKQMTDNLADDEVGS